MVRGDSFSAKIEGLDDFNSIVRRLKDEVPNKVGAAMFFGAETTRSSAVRSIQASGSRGRVYKRGNIEHTASTEGNAPNSDTGNLVNNITIEKIQGGYDVGSRKDAPYGLFLELGTSGMRPRPWLLPAYEVGIKAATQKGIDILVDYFKARLNK